MFWAYWQVSQFDVPLADTGPTELRSLMKSEECGFLLSVDDGAFVYSSELLVTKSGWSFLEEKLASVYRACDTERFFDWVMSQMLTLHFFEEVIICDKFLIAVIVLSVVNLAVYSLTSDSLIASLPKPGHEKFKLKMMPEKFIILTSVIARTSDSLLREKHFSLNRLSGAASCVLTDVTIFSMWYCILASISLAVKRITTRLEEAILPGQYSYSHWESTPFIRLTFLLFGVFCTSVATTSFTITSYRLIHPLYAAIFIIESIDLLLKSCYAVCLYLHSCFHKNSTNMESYRFVLFLSAISEHLLAVFRYSLYIYVGGFVNNKVVPLCFITPALCHLHGLMNAFKTSHSRLVCN